MNVVSRMSQLFTRRQPAERRSRCETRQSLLLDYIDYNGGPVCCWLRVFPQEDRVVVIATDLKGRLHCGATVTNTIEFVAQEACRRFGIAPRELVLIEHCPGTRADGREQELDGFGEQFHWARLHWDPSGPWFRDPTWIGLSRRAVESVLRQPLDDGPIPSGGAECTNG